MCWLVPQVRRVAGERWRGRERDERVARKQREQQQQQRRLAVVARLRRVLARWHGRHAAHARVRIRSERFRGARVDFECARRLVALGRQWLSHTSLCRYSRQSQRL